MKRAVTVPPDMIGPLRILRTGRPARLFSVEQVAAPYAPSPNGVPCLTVYVEATEANASLFAAAPDLLAACREAVSMLIDMDDTDGITAVLAMFRAAIAKAEGRAT